MSIPTAMARCGPTTTCAGGVCPCSDFTTTSHLARLVARQRLRSHLPIRPLDHDAGARGMTVAARYAAVVKAMAGKGGVTHSEPDDSKRGFGANALKVNKKIFAMLASDDRFVVKLPRARVDALVAAGFGERFDPRRNGRAMKEWLVVGAGREARWLPLAREALEFVSR